FALIPQTQYGNYTQFAAKCCCGRGTVVRKRHFAHTSLRRVISAGNGIKTRDFGPIWYSGGPKAKHRCRRGSDPAGKGGLLHGACRRARIRATPLARNDVEDKRA